MIFFAIVILLLIVIAFYAYISTIVIGIGIIGIVDGVSLAKRKKFAPIWWHILTVLITVFSTAMFYKDVFSESIDTGPLPFIILVVYGIFSLALIGISSTTKQASTVRKSKPERIDDIYLEDDDDDEPSAPSSLLLKVRKNLTVDHSTFRQFGATFKCNLIEEYDTLQLNFEVINTKQMASAIGKDNDLIIKANVYDAKGNLLCIEDVWLEYSQLRTGYAADYFYFTSEGMHKAHSMKIYALASTDELDDDFEDEEAEIPEEFVQSVYEEYQNWNTDLKQGLKKSPSSPTSKEYDWQLKERWEDYPAPDYDAMHTYCEVAFDNSGKTFYYRTRNPELKVGDEVYVPVGYKYQKKIGRIVSMEDFLGSEAPYPLERTKHIIGKV